MKRVTGWATGAVGALLLGACGSGSPPAPTASSALPLPAAERPACAAADGGDFWSPPGATGSDGAVLTLGSGPRGIMMIPQSDSDICQWLPTGRRLAANGYRVAMMNWAQPREPSVTAALKHLTSVGATRVVLVGASMGGAYAIYLAPKVHPAGVVSFSGEATMAGVDAQTAIRRYRGPLLLAGSTDDMYTPAAMTRALGRRHPGREQVVIVGGSAHGVALLRGPDRERVQKALDDFLASTLGQ